MVRFPNCKINLGLYVTAKRPDGYHDLETVFYPVPITDALEVIEDKSAEASSVRFTSSGMAIAGDPAQNLCVKAWHLLKANFPDLPPIQMHLHKLIPMGAGLGGGSSDGAFALQMLNDKFNLGLTTDQLAVYALQLGSDCPFFVYNQPCFARGRGELLAPVGVNLSGYSLVLVNPGIHVSTKEAFGGITPQAPNIDIASAILQPVAEWRHSLQNDFEKTVFALHPLLADIKTGLYNAGALYSAMSGSGSTMFALFANNDFTLPPYPQNWLVKQVQL